MKDSLFEYKGNFSSIRLAMVLSIICSCSLFLVAALGFFLNGNHDVVVKFLETGSLIFSVGVLGKTAQGVAENYKESKDKSEDEKNALPK